MILLLWLLFFLVLPLEGVYYRAIFFFRGGFGALVFKGFLGKFCLKIVALEGYFSCFDVFQSKVFDVFTSNVFDGNWKIGSL